VAYHVEVHRLVEEYLFRPEVISAQTALRLAKSLVENLASDGERYRKENPRVYRTDSLCFWYDYVIIDNGRLKHFWFAVSDARAVVGVLTVGYVELRQ
jgi:hypothetical protein